MQTVKAKTFEIQEKIFAYSRRKNEQGEQVRFLQIGSGDGVTHDPLYQSIVSLKWSGVFVEPVPYMFIQLKANYEYEGLDLRFIQAAISDKPGKGVLFHLNENLFHLPYWYNQLGSFSKQHVLEHAEQIPEIPELLTETEVNCMTVEQLLRQVGGNFDVVHIDAEGSDMEIVEEYYKLRGLPEMLLFESKHLDKKKYQSFINSLPECTIYEDAEDTLIIT